MAVLSGKSQSENSTPNCKTFGKRQNYPDSKRAVVARVGPQERGE